MAGISEQHYSNAYAARSGVAEFLEVALGVGEAPADFTVSFYQANGTLGFEVTLDDPRITVTIDPDNGETIYVLSSDNLLILLTDPDGGGPRNFEAFALAYTSASPGSVLDFYDIGVACFVAGTMVDTATETDAFFPDLRTNAAGQIEAARSLCTVREGLALAGALAGF